MCHELIRSPVKWRPCMRTDIDIAEDIFPLADNKHFETLTAIPEAKSLTSQISNIVKATEDMTRWGCADRAVFVQGVIPPISQISFQ